MPNLACRLAFRVEGDKWTAYIAQPNTMDGAIWIGSIIFSSVANNPARKHDFMALMQVAMSDVVEDAIGARPTWPNTPESAPEHERAGRA